MLQMLSCYVASEFSSLCVFADVKWAVLSSSRNRNWSRVQFGRGRFAGSWWGMAMFSWVGIEPKAVCFDTRLFVCFFPTGEKQWRRAWMERVGSVSELGSTKEKKIDTGNLWCIPGIWSRIVAETWLWRISEIKTTVWKQNHDNVFPLPFSTLFCDFSSTLPCRCGNTFRTGSSAFLRGCTTSTNPNRSGVTAPNWRMTTPWC